MSGSAETRRPDRIVGGLGLWTRGSVVAAAGLMLVATGWAVYRGRWSLLVMFGTMLLAGILRHAIVRGTVVDDTGIRRAGRRGIPWTDIEFVVDPVEAPRWVRLHRVGDGTVTLPGILASRAPDVATLGHKPVRPTPPARSVVSPTRSTAEQVEADIARRAQLLAEERADLEAQNWRYRRDHPKPSGR